MCVCVCVWLSHPQTTHPCHVPVTSGAEKKDESSRRMTQCLDVTDRKVECVCSAGEINPSLRLPSPSLLPQSWTLPPWLYQLFFLNLLFFIILIAIKAKFCEEVSLGLHPAIVYLYVCVWNTNRCVPGRRLEGFFVKMLCIYFFKCYDTVWTVRLISIPLSFVCLDSEAVNKW